MFSRAARNPVHTLNKCLEDARKQWFPDNTTRLFAAKVQVEMWPQTFSSTACGFAVARIGELAFTETLTTIVTHRETKQVRVYHDGRYAYTVESPNDYFKDGVMFRRAPGKVEYERSPWDHDQAKEKPSET